MLEKIFVSPKPLDKEKDRDLRVRPLNNFKHASSINLVPIYAGEAREACKTYPVVFVKDINGFMPIIITGHKEGVNNYVDKSGAWKEGAYVPALIRSYPFAVAENEGNSFIVYDSNYKGFAKDGEAIFTEDGELSELGQKISKNVSEVFSALTFTSELFKGIEDLFKQSDMNIQRDGATYKISQLQIIDEEKFAKIDKDRLEELKEKKILPIIYQHLLSLNNRV
ncbi:MAG: SapC family protein [Campylobacterales bacterium]